MRHFNLVKAWQDARDEYYTHAHGDIYDIGDGLVDNDGCDVDDGFD